MTSQLNIFTGDKVCDYCGHGSHKPGSPHLFDGFRDQDTGQLVCRKCKPRHYQQKLRGEFAHMYSEVPEMLDIKTLNSKP